MSEKFHIIMVSDSIVRAYSEAQRGGEWPVLSEGDLKALASRTIIEDGEWVR